MSSYYEKFLATGEVKCIDEEIPFEIPNGWEWCRLREVFNIWSARRVHEKDWRTSGIPFYRAREIGRLADYGYVENDLFIDRTLYEEFSKSGLPKIGDLMMTAVGTLGKTYIIQTDSPFYYKDGSVLCIGNPHKLNPDYLKMFFESSAFTNQYLSESDGTTVATLTMVRLNKYLIPIPPLVEQLRIVLRYKEITPLTNRYEQGQKALDRLNEEISDKLKKSTLQEAIQGKLAPQILEEGTAQELLEQIKQEKQKLVKEGKLKKSALTDSVIFKGDDNKYYEQIGGKVVDITDEIPFEIPDTWTWARIGILFAHNNGKQLNKSNSSGRFMEYITTSNLYWDGFKLDNLKKMPFEKNEIERCQAIKGDLLVCEGGDVGRACIWEYDFHIMLQNHIHKLRAYYPLCTKYFYYIFYLYNKTGIIGGKGIGIQGFSAKALHNTLIPLPPLNEQKRICNRISELFGKIKA